MKSQIYLPPQFTVCGKLYGNPVFQLRQPESISEEEITDVKVGRSNATRITKTKGKDILVIRSKKLPVGNDSILIAPDGELPTDEKRYLEIKDKMHWLKPKENFLKLTNPTVMERHCEDVRKSWKGKFVFIEEERENGIVVKRGLRSAQT